MLQALPHCCCWAQPSAGRVPAALGQRAATARVAPSARAVAVGASGNSQAIAPLSDLRASASAQPILVWLKHDLRVDDHEGLVAAAAAGGPVVPVFSVDAAQLAGLLHIPAGPEMLVGGLQRLRQDLRGLGSELVVVQGPWADALPALAKRVGARAVVAEEEVETSKLQAAASVLETLGSQGIQPHQWSADVWPRASFSNNYRTWQRQRPAYTQPHAAPPSLPGVPAGIDAGAIPTAAELRQLLNAHEDEAHVHSAVASVAAQAQASREASPEALDAQALIATGQCWLVLLAAYLDSGRRSSSGSSQAGSGALEAQLAAMVQQLETPAAEGASFPRLFATALGLGILSRRRVYHEAAQCPQPGALPARAAALTAESADFHVQLAACASEPWPAGMPRTVQRRHWRWQGFLTDYCCASPPDGKQRPGAPAILLVHGFGAFGDHWRGNLQALADQGFHVYAPTFPGFGRSEKAAVPYSQVLWSNFLRDFICDVVRRPVVVAGNSIGGFVATNMAADNPSIVDALVLLNSAGPIDASFSMAQWQQDAAAKKAPPKWIVQAVAGGLFWYLERTIPGTLKWLYPSAPERADEWLAEEIYRAACDAGAVAVFASVFYLPPPKALNFLINEMFRKPTLILQGGSDPLNDARGRARELLSLCPDYATLDLVDTAGHCPHDEAPVRINQGLLRFVEAVSAGKAEAVGAGVQRSA